MTVPSISSAAASPPPRVLLCDDHPPMLGLAAAALSGACSIVGTVEDGGQLLDVAALLRPDVIVLDISMPGINGLEASRKLHDSNLGIKLVFLTVHEDADFARAAYATGALGYVVKSRLASDLLPAVRAAFLNQRFLSPTVSLDEPA